jgi:endonuclease/exonuclease/phosphatase family metal-dependent hydrolase
VAKLAPNKLHFHTRKRIAMAVTVQSPNGALRIVNTHLDNRINREAKREQLREIQQMLTSYDGPCIIGGDFNSANFFWISHLLPMPGVQSLRAVMNQEMEAHGFTSGVTPIAFSDHNSVWVTIR